MINNQNSNLFGRKHIVVMLNKQHLNRRTHCGTFKTSSDRPGKGSTLNLRRKSISLFIHDAANKLRGVTPTRCAYAHAEECRKPVGWSVATLKHAK